MTLHLLCSVPCFIFRFVQKKKKKERKRGTRHSVWRSMMTEVFWSEPDVTSDTFLNTRASSFLNGATWVPCVARLLSEECWFRSLQHKWVLWKCKYDRRITQPGPESSQDTSRTCRHTELWWFSGEQAGVLPSLLACDDDDGLTQPALACGGQLKTTPRS